MLYLVDRVDVSAGCQPSFFIFSIEFIKLVSNPWESTISKMAHATSRHKFSSRHAPRLFRTVAGENVQS